MCAQSVSSPSDSISYVVDSSLWLLEPVPLSVSVCVCVCVSPHFYDDNGVSNNDFIPAMEEFDSVVECWLGVSSLDSWSSC